MLKSKEIRQQFLDFFANKNHNIVDSSSLVPQDDPTLIFTNAGMNQFKDVFLGQGKRAYNRAVDTQKCIRVSGKHNDLEEVGKDGYHHTFFEMLGNWSFGDYYKKEACAWAWELLTKVWKLDKERCYITVYEDDDEAVKIWQEITGWDETSGHIQRHGAKDNFWEMGEVGPCGPCSEIHYDRTKDKSGSPLVNQDHEDVIEIWNIVFIQYNRKQNGKLEELAAKHIDTGMGFERIVSVLQNKKSNYDTDIFVPILEAIEKLSNTPYKGSIPHQVIADHIRMVSFAIADGALPSNEGRGYVVRRVLRRAARFGRKISLDEPFLFKLVKVLGELYGDFFPEIRSQQKFITNLIEAEEKNFKKNLDRGIKLFDELISKLGNKKEISGNDAFILYDTYGFPIDMTIQMAEEKGLQVNVKDYEELLAKTKDKSRQQKVTNTNDWQTLKEIEKINFTGYENSENEVSIAKYRLATDKGKETYQLILDPTPFYAESGGQVGDTGTLTNENFSFSIFDTQKIDNQNVCLATLEKGQISNKKALAKINDKKRDAIRRNHTATHLLHQALKDVLGEHIQQKGSLVHADYLRFDFSHFQAISQQQLEEIEDLVNQQILKNTSLETLNKPLNEAKAMGASALFGEKYADEVRVIKIADYSLELCGGTHVTRTGDIGYVKIISESSIASGIRRIEAISGQKASEYSAKQSQMISELLNQVKCKESELAQRINNLIDKQKKLQKENELLKQKITLALSDELVEKAVEINGYKVIATITQCESPEALKNLAQHLLQKLKSGICVLGANLGASASLVVCASEDILSTGFNSNTIIKEISPHIKGGGGGHPRFAQAGGKYSQGLTQAIQQAKEIIKIK